MCNAPIPLTAAENSSKSCCCFNFSFPNPFRIFPWIFQMIFGKAEEGFSEEQLKALKQKNIKPLSPPEALKKPVEGLIDRVRIAVENNQNAWIGDALNAVFTYLKKDQDAESKLVDFITDLTSSTILNLLLNKTERDVPTYFAPLEMLYHYFANNHSQDQHLLNAIMGQLIPTNVPGTAYLQWTTPYIQRLPEQLQAYIKEQQGVDIHQLAKHTLFFDAQKIKEVFGNSDKSTLYMKKVLKLFLKPKLQEILKEEQNSETILRLLKTIEPSVNTGLENLIEIISPLIIDRLIAFYTNLYIPGNEVVDDLLGSVINHLDILIAAREEAGTPYLGLDLESLQNKIIDSSNLSREEEAVIKAVWGMDVFKNRGNLNSLFLSDIQKIKSKIESKVSLTKEERDIATSIWGDPHDLDISVDLERKNEGLLYNLLSYKRIQFIDTCPNPQLTAEYIKKGGLKNSKPAQELSDILFSILDTFFDNEFITQLITEASKHNTLVQYLGNIDGSTLKNLIPLLKPILKIYLSDQMQKEGGWFQQINQYVSVSGIDGLLVNSVMPSIKDSILSSLLNQVVLSNPSLLIDNNEDSSEQNAHQILEKCRAVHPHIDDSFIKVIKKYINDFKAYNSDKPRPANSKQTRQLIEAFLASDPTSQTTAAISHLANQVALDLSGLPGWLKWIVGMFSSLRDSYVSLALYPYRKESGYLTQILIDQIAEKFGTQEQVDALFNQSAPVATAKKAISLDESIEDIAQLIFATATYEGSLLNKVLMRIALGNNGSRVSTLLKNIFNRSLLQGSDINQFLILKVVRSFANKFKGNRSDKNEPEKDAKDPPKDLVFWEGLVNGSS